MKKLILFFAFVWLTVFIYGQSWTSSNQIECTDDLTEIETTTDENNSIITLGHFRGTLSTSSGIELTSYGGRDYYVAKISSNGDIVWIKQFGGTANDYAGGSIIASSSGSIYVTGGFQNDFQYSPTESISSLGGFDIFVLNLNSDGDANWCRNSGTGMNHQRADNIVIDKSGNLLLSGFFSDSISIYGDTTLYSNNVYADFFYCKLEADGDHLWTKQVESLNSTLWGSIYSTEVDDQNYVFTGMFAGSVVFEEDTVEASPDFYRVFALKTDLTGNKTWLRTIHGDDYVYSFSSSSDLNSNIYISGYYRSSVLEVDSTEVDTFKISGNNGDFDCFVMKYDSDGIMQWIRTNGGPGVDKISSSTFNNNEITVAGLFAENMSWGGIQLSTLGIADRDMFIGSITEDGEYRSANSYSGRNNSEEDARAVFFADDETYTVIRTNSDILELGDSLYTSSGDHFYIAIGIVGCLPISVDNTIYNNVETCFGDSTGSIQISATGGFGDPWVYSIDNGSTSSSTPFFADLPAGDYQVVVIDEEGCAQTGPLVTLTEPDTLLATVNYKEDILHHTKWSGVVEITEGSLVITVAGGTGPYTYQLIPGGVPQVLGTFSFALEDSGRYVVALNDIHNCGPSETDSVDINVIRTSIPDAIEGFDGVEVKMYPNPTSGIITLELPFDKAECSMEVLNMTGQVVLQKQIYPSSGMISEVIDLSKVPKGLYLLRIDGRSLKSAIVVK